MSSLGRSPAGTEGKSSPGSPCGKTPYDLDAALLEVGERRDEHRSRHGDEDAGDDRGEPLQEHDHGEAHDSHGQRSTVRLVEVAEERGHRLAERVAAAREAE